MAIYESLNTIQTKLKAPKGQNNDFGHYKYRSCEDILKAVKSLLDETKTTLILNDDIVQVGTRYYIKATATLTDGTEHVSVSAFAREQESKKGMDEAQVTGATSSYARKYALCGLFAIDGEDDQDTMDNRQEGVKNRLASRSSGTSNAAKGNYTKAEPEKASGVPKRSTEQKTVNAGGGNTRTKLNIHMMQEAGKRGAQRNLLEFAAKYGVKQFDDITRLSDNDFTKLYTDFMTWLNPA